MKARQTQDARLGGEMSDIVDRLRDSTMGTIEMDRLLDEAADLLDEATDEIERLRAALREIITTDPSETSYDWFQEWKHLAFKLKGIARRALEGTSGEHVATSGDSSNK